MKCKLEGRLLSPHLTRTETLYRIQLPLHFAVFFDISRRETNTYISPLVEEFSCVPLQLLVPFVAHNRRTATGQAFLSNVHMVALHPLGPVATITAVNEACTLEEQGCSCHYRSFLKCLQKITLKAKIHWKNSPNIRVLCALKKLLCKLAKESHSMRNLSIKS